MTTPKVLSSVIPILLFSQFSFANPNPQRADFTCPAPGDFQHDPSGYHAGDVHFLENSRIAQNFPMSWWAYTYEGNEGYPIISFRQVTVRDGGQSVECIYQISNGNDQSVSLMFDSGVSRSEKAKYSFNYDPSSGATWGGEVTRGRIYHYCQTGYDSCKIKVTYTP